MKKFFLLSVILFIVSCGQLLSQKFMKYQTWATEKYQYPGNPQTRLLVYDSIKFVLKGNWNNCLDEGISIPSLVYILTDQENLIRIYTVESQGYRNLNPAWAYDVAYRVNIQEGLSLDEYRKDTLIYQHTDSEQVRVIPKWDRTAGLSMDQYTDHPTIFRYIDGSSPRIFANPENIKFAISGDFFGDGKDL